MKTASRFVKRRNAVRSLFFVHENPPAGEVRQNHFHRALDGPEVFRDDFQRGAAQRGAAFRVRRTNRSPTGWNAPWPNRRWRVCARHCKRFCNCITGIVSIRTVWTRPVERCSRKKFAKVWNNFRTGEVLGRRRISLFPAFQTRGRKIKSMPHGFRR